MCFSKGMSIDWRNVKLSSADYGRLRSSLGKPDESALQIRDKVMAEFDANVTTVSREDGSIELTVTDDYIGGFSK